MMENEELDDARQRQMIEQAEAETDQLYLSNFEQLSSRYISEIKDRLTD